MKPTRALALGAVVLLACLPACDVSSPERIIRAPIIREFKPETQSFDVTTRDTIAFSISALDPEDEELYFSFSLDDSVVAGGPTWTYIVDDTGLTDVTAHVFNRASQSKITWRLNRFAAINQPPVVDAFQPVDKNPSVIVGNSVAFSMSASDPEGLGLSYIFTVEDSLVAASNRYTYMATEIGDFTIRAVASDGESFVAHEWELSVLAEPDSILPGPVFLTSLTTGTETGELVVAWVAVGDDGDQGLPTNYIVRTSRVTIDGEPEWDQASDRPGEPNPEAPGTIQQMVIKLLPPADRVWVAVRAIDDFGNLSPLGNTLDAIVKGNDLIGIVRDAATGDPAPGIRVKLAGDIAIADAQGHYALTRLPNGTGPIRVDDEDDHGAVGSYFDILTEDYTIQDGDVRDFWVIPNIALETTDYASFLSFIIRMSTLTGTYGHLLRTWDEPVDVYVPPFQANGLDYEQVVKQALTEWEDLTGIDLFQFVDEQPTNGVYFAYSDVIARDAYRAVSSDPQQLPLLGEVTMRTVYSPSSAVIMDAVAGHEFGHALGLHHSSDAIHLMVGSQVANVTQPSTDEIWLVRTLYRLPRGQNMNWFLED